MFSMDTASKIKSFYFSPKTPKGKQTKEEKQYYLRPINSFIKKKIYEICFHMLPVILKVPLCKEINF